MARVLETFGDGRKMWHRNDIIPDGEVLDSWVNAGWVEAAAPPPVEAATAAPGETRTTTRTAKKTPAKKATKKSGR